MTGLSERRIYGATLLLAVTALIAACNGGGGAMVDAGPGTPDGQALADRIVLTSGNGQNGPAGSPVAAAFVVTVEDANHNPVAGVTVEFVVTAGGGSVSVPSVATDALGQAQTTLTLGSTAGTNTVEATAPGLLAGSPVVFTAVGVSFVASFEAKVNFGAGAFPFSVAIGDLNGDGKLDLAVVNSGSNSVSVLLNTTAMGATPPSFAATVDFTTGLTPLSVATGDLNGDGKLDLAVANLNSDTVSVFLNTTAVGAASPSFSAKVDFPMFAAVSPFSVAIGDLNGDGKLDLAVSLFDDSTIAVLVNMTAAGGTTPSFSTALYFSAGGLNPRSVAIDDLNGDGKLDLAVVCRNTGVNVLLNTAAVGATSPSFSTSPFTFATGLSPLSVAIGDLNGGGKPDLAVANSNSSTVSVLLNTTTAGGTALSFEPKVDFTTGSSPQSVAMGDFNGDGKLDLAVSNRGSASVSVLLNTTAAGASPPSFVAKVDFPTGTGPVSVAIGDVNGDGKLDLAVANYNDNTVSVLLGL